jgi:hypothetical protein
MADFYTVLTTLGENKLANASVTGPRVRPAIVAVGDGGGPSFYDNYGRTALKARTSLVNEQFRTSVNDLRVETDNPNWIVVDGLIPANEGGYNIREVGVIDEDGDLIAIGRFPQTFKPVLDSGAFQDMIVRVIMEVADVESLTLQVDPSAVLATREYVDSERAAHVASADPHTQYLKEAEYEARISREALLKQATLSLDFANNKYEVYEGPVNSLTQMPFNTALDFNRASAATATNAVGKMVDVGVGDQRLIGNREGLLLEEAQTNLLVSSTTLEDFGEQRMVKTQYSEVAPDNTLNAVLLASDNTGSGYAFSGYTTAGSGETYTFSCFYKAAASDQVVFGFYGSASRAVINQTRVEADLIAGTIVVFGGSNPESYGIEAFPNGWYRCWITVTTDQSGSLGETLIFLGNGDSVYAWGAQIEEGSFPTSVIPDGTTFTSRASTATYIDSTGTLQTAGVDVARDDAYGYMDGVLKPIGLLLEEQRTNLEKYGDISSNWELTRGDANYHNEIFIDGELSATTITCNEYGSMYLFRRFIDYTQGKTYTASYYVKSGSYTGDVRLVVSDNIAEGTGIKFIFNIGNGTITDVNGEFINAEIEKTSNGFYRVWVTFTAGSTGSGGYTTFLWVQDAQIGDSIITGGMQFEEGSYPTSYIPTQGTQVTRAADVSSSPQVTRTVDECVRTLGDEFNPDEGTIYVEYEVPSRGGFSSFAITLGKDGSDYIGIGYNNSAGANTVAFIVINGTAYSAMGTSEMRGEYGETVRTTLSFKAGEPAVFSSRGVSVSAVTSLPSDLSVLKDSLKFNGQVGGGSFVAGRMHVKDFKMFPTALTEAELIALTGGN